ncbi:hypothetical protein G3I61_15030 [Streptomyces diastaticus]|nr:hypothetical protein [Streptomyces diastaticus]
MHQLVGRLNSLDPQAGETLRIVSYFDVLITRGAGLDGLLRGAAVLSGTVAGAEIRGRVTRRDPDGHPVTGDVDRRRHSTRRSHADWAVWLERDGKPEPDDEMVVERLALGVELLERVAVPSAAWTPSSTGPAPSPNAPRSSPSGGSTRRRRCVSWPPRRTPPRSARPPQRSCRPGTGS